jgi:hypothetical protein
MIIKHIWDIWQYLKTIILLKYLKHQKVLYNKLIVFYLTFYKIDFLLIIYENNTINNCMIKINKTYNVNKFMAFCHIYPTDILFYCHI